MPDNPTPITNPTRWNLYLSDFNKNGGWWCLSLLGIGLLIYPAIRSFTFTYLIDPILGNFPDKNYLIDIALIAFAGSVIYRSISKLGDQLFPSLTGLVFATTAFLLYIGLFRIDNHLYFYPFHFCPKGCIRYADVFLLSLSSLLLTYKSYALPLKKDNSALSLIEDGQNSDEPDQLRYQSFSKRICDHINASTTQTNSFAIAVTGEWGSGKSFFLKHLKINLKSDENIPVDFNPWKLDTQEGITEEFFKTLGDALKPYNHSITRKLKEYSKKILQTGKEIQYRALDAFFGDLVGSDSVEKHYEDISSSIRNTGKRVIVYIDDIDRLSGKEILKVIRIIRNTGNFSNTFFVVAFDEQYVIQTLTNSKEIANEGEYLKKIFQLTITLPLLKKTVLENEVRKHLLSKCSSEEEQIDIATALNDMTENKSDIVYEIYPGLRTESIFESSLDNIRDVKRFCNSFQITYNAMKGEIDLHDVIVLELLRNRNSYIYNLVRNYRIFGYEEGKADLFTTNKTEIDRIRKSVILDDNEFKKIYSLLEYLTTDQAYKSSRKFLLTANFPFYFKYDTDGDISKVEFNKLLDGDIQAIVAQFTEWANAQKQLELFRMIADTDQINSSEKLAKIVEACLTVKGDEQAWFSYAYKFLFGLRDANLKLIFDNNSEQYRQFIADLAHKPFTSSYKRALLVKPFLELFFGNNAEAETGFILTKKQAAALILELFVQHLQNIKRVLPETLQFLYLNIHDQTQDSKYLLNPEALEHFRILLTEDSHLFADYANLLIRPKYIPMNKELVFEPFLRQIFRDQDEFKHLLTVNQFIDDRLKDIIIRQLVVYYGNPEGQTLELENSDYRYLDTNLPHLTGILRSVQEDDY